MITAYICSPYRAENKKELKRNKKYAKEITRTVLDSGIAPINTALILNQSYK
jgi:hypothetical protein